MMNTFPLHIPKMNIRPYQALLADIFAMGFAIPQLDIPSAIQTLTAALAAIVTIIAIFNGIYELRHNIRRDQDEKEEEEENNPNPH